ncbi:unnamed protein product [Camellia sinensis]
MATAFVWSRKSRACLCHFTLFFSVYIALPLFGRDDDLDDGEIDSFIDSETDRCTTLISNRNP